MYGKLSYYLQMVAAYLLLAFTHYFASAFLPIADCDETFNFIEPLHYLLYGSGKQTWELCVQYALRSWLFSWVYAWPAVFIRGAATLSSADVYFYLRIFNGRIAALAELFFVYSIWSTFSGKTAMVALLLLLVNYPIPHAAVSALPTSFAMTCNFMVLSCWLRTRDLTAATIRETPTRRSRQNNSNESRPRHIRWLVGLALFFSVWGGITGWPFAGLVSAPIGLDLLFRFPQQTVLYMAVSVVIVVAAGMLMDAHYYCRWTLSGWNVVLYNVFGGADRGPSLFDVEPWFFFWKNLTLNFNLMFVAVLCAPPILLCAPRRSAQPTGSNSGVADHISMGNDGADSNSEMHRNESASRFTSSEDVRSSGHISAAAAPTSPLTRARLHSFGATDRRSPLLSSRHSHLNSSRTTAGASLISVSSGCSRGRELLYSAPFFLWFVFWMCIAHKEERFMSPAYPFMVMAATRSICLAFFPDVTEASQESTPTATVTDSDTAGLTTASPVGGTPPSPSFLSSPRSVSPHHSRVSVILAWRRTAGYVFLILFFLLSYSRAMAVYTFYGGPERVFYDWYPVLRAEARKRWKEKQTLGVSNDVAALRGATPQQTMELKAYFTLCLGREWYRFPSSFFVDHRYVRYQFLKTSFFHGMLPVSFITPAAGEESGFLLPPHDGEKGKEKSEMIGGACTCGADHVNDLNQEIAEQYVHDPVTQCDAIFDSLSPPTHVSAVEQARERRQWHLDTVFTRSLLNITEMQTVLAAEGEMYHPVDTNYAVIDVDRTPLWCRVLYYPFGISKRCAAWRPLVLNVKP